MSQTCISIIGDFAEVFGRLQVDRNRWLENLLEESPRLEIGAAEADLSPVG